MTLNNIFSRKETDQVRVPEIEVQGDRLTVQRTDQGPEEDPPELGPQNHESRSYRLPKTKWF